MSGFRLLVMSSFANIVDLKDVHACMHVWLYVLIYVCM